MVIEVQYHNQFVMITGSGSLAAMAVFEDGFKPNMEVTVNTCIYVKTFKLWTQHRLIKHCRVENIIFLWKYYFNIVLVTHCSDSVVFFFFTFYLYVNFLNIYWHNTYMCVVMLPWTRNYYNYRNITGDQCHFKQFLLFFV